MKIGICYLIRISKTKITIPVLVVASIFAITMISFSPINVSAEYDQFTIPEISGTIEITEESNDYSDKGTIALSVAMAVAENSVENGKAIWGKLDVVQGFLVYKIGILTFDDVFHKSVIDAGSGEELYWEYHDFAYANQGHENDGWANSENLKLLVSGIDGLDTDSFNECLDSKKYEQRVKDNKKIASDAGARSTPSFIIIPQEGQAETITGAQPYGAFKAVIDEMTK